MKYTIVNLLLSMVTMSSIAQEYKPVDTGSSVKFHIKNLGINTGGSFTGLKGTIHFDPKNPGSSNLNVSVDATTVDTDIKARDKHLRKEEYFYVEKYPLISFVSTKIEKLATDGSFTIHGKLTIRGVTKEISFPFAATPKNDGYLFVGQFTIDRLDYKVGSSSGVMGDKVKIELSIFAQKNVTMLSVVYLFNE